ncbi:MAG TPA: DUF2867 domain-containing protein [Dermatophilaceae bacterium]|nr:DUF2867 domain-containing protein [Dermatophilaceae bacterium]
MHTERRVREVAAPAPVLWDVLATVGGDNGWYAAQPGWRVRAAVDRAVGGPGMRTGRPGGEPEPGEAVDFWRVESVDPGRRLRLRAEMRMPGTAWLELGAEPLAPGRSRLVQRTEFEPAGVAGQAYWWVEWPVHQLVFRAMVRSLAREAERRAAGADPGRTPTARQVPDRPRTRRAHGIPGPGARGRGVR